MTTITLRYNENNTAIASMIAALLNFDGIEKIETRKRKSTKGIDEAIDDFENGRTTKCTDFDDYLKKINA